MLYGVGWSSFKTGDYDRAISVFSRLVERYPKSELAAGEVNPRDIKRRLAAAIVTRYHDAEKASRADEEFMGVFSRRDQLPDDVPEVHVADKPIGILDLIDSLKLAPSRSEARRLVQQGGVTLDGEKISDHMAEITPRDGAVLRVGKRKFVRLRVG